MYIDNVKKRNRRGEWIENKEMQIEDSEEEIMKRIFPRMRRKIQLNKWMKMASQYECSLNLGRF